MAFRYRKKPVPGRARASAGEIIRVGEALVSLEQRMADVAFGRAVRLFAVRNGATAAELKESFGEEFAVFAGENDALLGGNDRLERHIPIRSDIPVIGNLQG